MFHSQTEYQTQLRLLQWVAYAGEQGAALVPPEAHGEEIRYALRAVLTSQKNGARPAIEVWYHFLLLVFRHEVRSSPWGLVLLHAIQGGKSKISEGVYLSPLPKFLYPQECAVLGCNNQLSSIRDKQAILNDKEGQIKCSNCKGTNKNWDKIVQRLKPAFEITFTATTTNVDPLEGFRLLMAGYEQLVGYLIDPVKLYTPQCQLFKECQDLGVEFVQSLLLWPPHQPIKRGENLELYRPGEVRNLSAPNLPDKIFRPDNDGLTETLEGKIITHFCDETSSPMAYLPIKPPALDKNGQIQPNESLENIPCEFQVEKKQHVTLKGLQEYLYPPNLTVRQDVE